MKFMKHNRILQVLAFLATITSCAPASADWVFDPSVYAAVNSASAAITQAITAQTGVLTGNLTALQAGLANAIAGAAQTTSTASAGAARVVSESAQRTASEQAIIRNEQRFSGMDPCNVLVSTIGLPSATRSVVTAAGGGGGGGAPRSAPGSGVGMAHALNVAEGRIPAGIPEIEAATAAKGACSTFANGGVRGQNCTAAGFPPSDTSGFPNADTRASTLFDGPQTSADGTVVKRRLTVDLAGVDGTAIRALERNLNTPLELKALTPAQLATDAGRQFMALEDSYTARMSVAQYPQEEQANLLAAKPELIPLVQQMLKSDDAQFVQTYLSSNVPNWATQGISMADLIELEVQRRYMNPQWHLRLLTMSDTDLARENVSMLALNAWLKSLGLERQIVQSVIASSTAQSTIRSELMPQLIAAHARAVNR
ncbi:MAG: hypothetical protein EPN79_11395 [Burkholderiaceae bacterium]|nr:MAG: hypothetical protein EPN79_11395 [Burkholderiaceae bacterium]TBR76711.1 MAG: hypothetical protein EPN64_05675 [Burkholderiaceae bacterium]